MFVNPLGLHLERVKPLRVKRETGGGRKRDVLLVVVAGVTDPIYLPLPICTIRIITAALLTSQVAMQFECISVCDLKAL